MTTTTRNPDGSGMTARRTGCAAWIELCRPERANAYTQDMLEALERHIEDAEADPAIRVIVITGAGDRVFSAGADRNELARRDWRSVLSLRSARAFERLRQSPCVTIAAINGAAVGGGVELAIACDLRLAVSTARFWLPEPELGLLPAAGGTRLLPQLVGELRAKELILGGAVWSAAEALLAGLLTEVVEPRDLASHVEVWVDRIARRDPDALRLAKHAIQRAASGHADAGFDLIAQSLLVRGQRGPST
jgi:enoyl-CoA hydratase/carnithine racemase